MDVLTDPRLIDLFKLFDEDGSSLLSFQEVALGLYQLTKDMDRSAQITMEALLMMGRDDNRTLNYEQFARLILAVVASAGTTFDEIADDLALALTRTTPICDADISRLLVADGFYEAAKDVASDMKHETLTMTALSFCRLQRLFDIWDVDGDGNISFAELTKGLRIFQQAAGNPDDAEKDAQILLAFDEDGDHRLGRKEFALAMAYYADVYKVDLHELIDFMCVTTMLGGEKTKSYQNAFRQSLGTGQGNRTVRPIHLQYYDEPADADS
jgi:Ca2+-binding EF-hand superfamily protein